MVYSASIAMPDNPKFARYATTHFLSRHVLSIFIALVCALVAVQVPASAWEKWSPWLFAATLLLLVLVLIPVIGKGRQRRAALDPARGHELPAVRTRQADDRDVRRRLHGAQDGREGEVLRRRAADGGIGRRRRPAAARRARHGAFMVIAAIAMGILFLGGVNGRMFFLITAVLLSAFVLMITMSEWRRERIFAYLNPWDEKYTLGKAYQLALADRVRPRRALRPGARRQRREAALPARGAHRLPARGDRRGTRASSASPWSSSPSSGSPGACSTSAARRLPSTACSQACSPRASASGWAARPSSTWASTSACCRPRA